MQQITEVLPETRPEIRIVRGHSKRLRRGHPWIYSNEIEMNQKARAIPTGALVEVIDAGEEHLGVATFNAHSLIAARILTERPGTAIDRSFFADRLHRALMSRAALYDAPYYRLVHAEADGLPGLVIDRFGGVAVCQINSAGMELLCAPLLEAIDHVIGPRAIVLRGDSPVRALEGLGSKIKVAKGEIAGPVEVVEAGVRLSADVLGGQKTGWYFDHRDNRDFIARLSAGRSVLDVYCHTGGFGLRAAAAGAESILGIDRAQAAITLAEQTADANGMAARCRFLKSDAFAALGRLDSDGERFDVVIADPPSFAKTRKEVKPALRAYRKLARLGATLVAPEGYLALASCSYHVVPAAFAEAVARGLNDSGRTGRIIRTAGAGPDHPVHPALPESAYLKFIVLALD